MNTPDSNEHLSADERQFERSLSQLSAARLRFDDRQIWAIATARAEHHRVLFWRGVSSALAACLALVIWMRFPGPAPSPAPTPSAGIAILPTPAPHPSQVSPVFVS